MSLHAQRHGVRIPPVSEPDEAQQAILAKAPVRPDGTVRNIFLTLAHHPMLLKRFNAFAGTFFLSDLVSAYDRELIVLRVAARIGARYEYAQHLSIARDAGIDDAMIATAMLQPGCAAPSAADALLLRATDAMLAEGELDGATFAALAERWDPPALIEVLFTIGFYRMTGEVLNTVGVSVEEEPDLPVDWAAATAG